MKSWILSVSAFLTERNIMFCEESPRSIVLLEGRSQIMKDTKEKRKSKTPATEPNL